MEKPTKLKTLVDLSEASNYLTENLPWQVTQVDILQLCLDGHLSLAVDLPDGAVVQKIGFPKEIPSHNDAQGKHIVPRPENEPIPFGPLEKVYGEIFELSMLGGERVDVWNECEIFRLSAAPEFKDSFSPVILRRITGELFFLMEWKAITPYHSEYTPVDSLPGSGLPFVLVKSLNKFIESSAVGSKDTELPESCVQRLVAEYKSKDSVAYFLKKKFPALIAYEIAVLLDINTEGKDRGAAARAAISRGKDKHERKEKTEN